MKKNEALEKLAKQEEAFFNQLFFCPVMRSWNRKTRQLEAMVRLRIAGTVVTLKIRPKNFEGWGVFAPVSYREAKFIREPNMEEKEQYMKLFPRLRLILCRRTNDVWHGIPANQADTRFRIQGLVPVRLPQEVQLFDVVVCRFDGENMFYQEHDSRQSAKNGDYLREQLVKLLEPAKLELEGLSQEERDAYLMALGPALEADAEARKDHTEERLKKALTHAGAQYTSYIERDQTYTIEYTVDGHTHRSVVDKKNLEVQSAGICLAGGDRNFDLQSLVGVIRQGRRRGGRLVNVPLNQNYGYGGIHGEGVGQAGGVMGMDNEDNDPYDDDDW